MTAADCDERAWWVFRMPQALAHVPADTEQRARSILAATCYKDAPVDTWPLVATRWASRQALVQSVR